MDEIMDIEVIQEKASPDYKKKLTGKKFNVIDPKELVDAEKPISDAFVDFSALNGLTYGIFQKRFIQYCKMMMEYYRVNILYIPLEETLATHGADPSLWKGNSVVCNLHKLLTTDPTVLGKEIPNFTFIFSYGGKWFAINTSSFTRMQIANYKDCLKYLLNDYSIRNATGTSSKKPIEDKKRNTVTQKVDKKKQEEEMKEKKKEALVDAIATAAEHSSNADEVLADPAVDNTYIASILQDLEDSEYGKPKFSNSRTSRLTKVNDDFMSSTLKGKSVKEMIDNPSNEKELPSTKLKVASINDEWEDMKFINFNKSYDLDEDIVAILGSFANKEYPVVVKGITVEDTSTSLDYIETYHVEFEDSAGKRFTLHIDIPKFTNNRFMKLRGNEKVITGQLMNLPCTKTDQDTVQLVSNYNKIFVYRYGSNGKSYASADRLLKTLRKYKGSKLKISFGDNRKICDRYELPIDYIDLAGELNYVETTHMIYYFDQDIYYEKYNADKTKGIPYAIRKEDGFVYYYAPGTEEPISFTIGYGIASFDDEFAKLYDAQKVSTKYMYSRARIMSGYIPLVVVICNVISFNEMLKRAKIKYRIENKRVKYDPDKEGLIKFNDAYLLYELNYASSMLMNGLKDLDTESIPIGDLNKRRTWIDYLDNYGGRILADGLDNFSELFLDPITVEVCKDCNLPTDYVDLLIYSNNLLADNKYIKHTDITGNRYRTNEIIAGHLYKTLCSSYSDYKAQKKRGKNVGMTMKRTAVIDEIMSNPVMSDLSVMTPLLEVESNYSATFKGLSGLNADRAYGLDKRTYDPSMLNKLSLSTGFANNVGINRQTTMDMDIQGKRGYIKNSDPEDVSVTKRLSATEGVTPFGTTRDDPFRSAMTYIQTAKHSMPTAKAAPLLITNGTEEALPYMVSDTFAYKAKQDGTVEEIVENQHMVVTYKDGTGEYISLKEETKKNSDGGFFLVIQLSTDLKEKSKFRAGDIIAYDKKNFSNKVGEDENLAYNVGVLTKVAIMATDEGFEDSTSISRWLSEAMGTQVSTEIPVSIGANVNVYDVVKVGSYVQEGDPLIVMQDSVTEKDAAMLLHNLTDSDYVSDLGRIKIKSKYTGIVQDIKMYRTCELDELSPSIKKVVKAYEDRIKETKKLYKKYNIQGENTLDPDFALAPTGKLKNVGDGVLIDFYITYSDTMSVGDKLVAQSANKGVVKYLFPLGDEPYSELRPDQQIHAIFSSRSFNARMVTSPIISGAINKGLIELDRQVKEIMGIKQKRVEDMQ